MFSARLLVLALSPSSYRGPNRVALAHHVVKDTAPILIWFTLLSSIISLVIIHIVVVTSVSYGLSRFALEMVVRVLVLELIPLTAAMFVALRCALPNAAEIAALHGRGDFDVLSAGSSRAAAARDPAARRVGHVLGDAAGSCQLRCRRGARLPLGPRRDDRRIRELYADVRPCVQPGAVADLHAEDAGPELCRRIDSDRVGSLRSSQAVAGAPVPSCAGWCGCSSRSC